MKISDSMSFATVTSRLTGSHVSLKWKMMIMMIQMQDTCHYIYFFATFSKCIFRVKLLYSAFIMLRSLVMQCVIFFLMFKSRFLFGFRDCHCVTRTFFFVDNVNTVYFRLWVNKVKLVCKKVQTQHKMYLIMLTLFFNVQREFEKPERKRK